MRIITRCFSNCKLLINRGVHHDASKSEVVKFRSLWKHFAYSISFTAVSFSAASIFQYERIRNRIEHPKNEINDVHEFKSLDDLHKVPQFLKQLWYSTPVHHQLFFTICSANIAVTLLWKVKRFGPFMKRYFLSSASPNQNYSSMFLSTFSHSSIWHLAFNMFVLNSFSPIIIKTLGAEQFTAFYCSAGVFSSFFSLVAKVLSKNTIPSLGASGALMAVIGYVCTEYPKTQLCILFLPNISFYADNLIKGVILFETCGIILNLGFFDHAAHLSGALLGILYAKYGKHYLWSQRHFIVNYWHQLRGPVE